MTETPNDRKGPEMPLTVELPEQIERELRQLWGERELPRKAAEALVIEAYREGLISRGKLGELLGMSFAEREEFLSTRGVPYNYCPEDLEQDRQTMDRILSPRA